MPSKSKLSKKAKRFLGTNFIAHLEYAIIRLFINIYLWRITEDLFFLVVFNLIYEVSRVLAYIPAGKISKEYNRFVPLRIGFFLQFFYLLFLVFLREQIITYFVVVAILGGVSRGIYISSDNLLKFDLTNPKNRLEFSSWGFILKHLAYGITPLFVGFLIVINGGDVYISYTRIFVLGMIIAFSGFVSTLFISKEKTLTNEKYSLIKASKKFLKRKEVMIGATSNFLRYVADILPILISFLIYFSSGTELSIGKYQIVIASITLVGGVVVKKYLSTKNYKVFLIGGGILNFLSIFILFVSQEFSAILLYGILSSVFSLGKIPLYPKTLDALNNSCRSKEECVDLRVEYITFSEMFVGLGRIVGFSMLLLINSFSSTYVIGIIAMILAFADLLANLTISRVNYSKFVKIDDLN